MANYNYRADGVTVANAFKLYPKDQNGADFTGAVALQVVPAGCGTLSNVTTGTDGGGRFYIGDYTPPTSVMTGCNIRATAGSQTCDCPFTLFDDSATPVCPCVTDVTLGALVAGAQLVGQINADGVGTVVFSKVSGPASITVGTSGALGGTLPVAGDYTLVVGMVDSDGVADCEFELDLTVSDGAVQPGCPSLSNVTLGALTPGEALTGNLVALSDSGNVSFTAVSLPSGVVLTSNGTLSGTVPNAGTSTISFTMSDGVRSCPGELNLNIAPLPAARCPAVASVDLGALVAGQTLTGQLQFIGTGSISASPRSLPAGVTVSSTGTIGGTVPDAGSHLITLEVTDDEATCDVVVAFVSTPPEGAECPRLSDIDFANNVDGAQSIQFTGLGAGTIAYSSVDLPTGSTLTDTGLFTGTLTEGDYSFTLSMNDGEAICATNVSFAVPPAVVECPRVCPVFGMASLPDGTIGEAYPGGQIVFTGTGDVSYQFITSNTGLSIDSTGIITGTYQGAVGTTSETVRVTDDDGFCDYVLVFTGAEVPVVEEPPETVDCACLEQVFALWLADYAKDETATCTDFMRWVCEQGDRNNCHLPELTVWLNCNKEIAGVKYHATCMQPAPVKVSRETAMQLIANGEATLPPAT